MITREKAVSSTTLRSETFHVLRKEILTGALAPGARLAEAELAPALGVSRNPVREALAKLEEQGLVVLIPNQGARVAQPPEAELRGTLMIRAQIELLAVRLIMWTVESPDLSRLAEIAREMQVLDEEKAIRNPDTVGRLGWLDAEFHQALATCAGDEGLLRTWEAAALADLPLVYAVGLTNEPGSDLARNVHRTARAHARLLSALASGDAAQAEAAIKTHFRGSLDTEMLTILGWQ